MVCGNWKQKEERKGGIRSYWTGSIGADRRAEKAEQEMNFALSSERTVDSICSVEDRGLILEETVIIKYRTQERYREKIHEDLNFG